jgi:hypothetical protein
MTGIRAAKMGVESVMFNLHEDICQTCKLQQRLCLESAGEAPAHGKLSADRVRRSQAGAYDSISCKRKMALMGQILLLFGPRGFCGAHWSQMAGGQCRCQSL